jgi:chromosome partitioning protein
VRRLPILQKDIVSAWSNSVESRPDRALRAPGGGRLLSAEALVIGLVNQKGGCGKTTTAVNLSASLAAQGHQTLLVDLDPQANATVSLGVDPASLERTIYHVIIDPDHEDGLPLESIIQKSTVKRLDIAPSSIDLAAAELELAARIGRETALRKRLAPVRDKYSFILIDTPPSLGLLTLNALVACDGIIIPIQTHYYALLGMRQLLRTLKMVRDEVGHQAEILGVLPTMYDSRTAISKEIVGGIHEFFPNKVYQTTIHFNIKLVESSMAGVPLYLRNPESRGAKEYMSLASEVIAHAKRARGAAARR